MRRWSLILGEFLCENVVIAFRIGSHHAVEIVWHFVATLSRTSDMPTFLITPCSRALLGKLTGFQLVKKFPVFYVTRRFIIAFTNARLIYLLWASLIQSILQHPTSWRFIIILCTHLLLCLRSVLFPCIRLSIPYELQAQPISFFPILSPEQIWERNTDHLASQ